MPTRLTPFARSALLIGLLVLLSGATVALTTPTVAGTPTGYLGTVTDNGQPAAAGSTLVARIADTVVGTCTVTTAGTYHLELTAAALDTSVAGRTVHFSLNEAAIAETAVVRTGTMQALALSVSQPVPAAQRIAAAPAAASVPVVATPAAQRIASAPTAGPSAPTGTPTATPAPTPAVAAAIVPAAAVQPQRVAATPMAAVTPTTTAPAVQVAGTGSGPTAQQAAHLPATPSTTQYAPLTTLSTTTAVRTTPIAPAGAPVASAPAAQRPTGTTPTQLPSTGIGLRADTPLSLAVALPTLLLTTALLGTLTLAGRRMWPPPLGRLPHDTQRRRGDRLRWP
jgi:hypothetical protein